uniref:DNTTIP1_dimer domain-containing protein n=1 Tax=Globodera pallida TaxID=36090 RepID=A0A183CJ95_GLOPA
MHDVEHEKTYIPGNGNGNKLNRRLEMLERLLRASDGDGTCARTNSLRQALRRNKSDMADDTAKSLDVLRQVFQADLTEEIKQVIDRYVRASFTPAFENLRRNGNEVTEADIAKLCVDILNGAKAAFEPTTAAVPTTTMAQEMPTVTDDECCGTEAKYRRRRCVPAFTALLKPLSQHPQPLQQQQQQNVCS